MQNTPRVHITTLGGASVAIEGQEVKLKGGREFALLVYLAWNPSRIRRDNIIDLLWTPGERTRRLHSLSQLVYRLGQVLPRGVLLPSTVDLALRQGAVMLDAARFRTAIASGRNQEAYQLYAGSFLADVDLPSSPAFVRWRDDVATELKRLADVMLYELLTEYEQAADWRKMERVVKQLLDSDPENFDLHQRRVRLLLMQGKQAEARSLHAIFAGRTGADERANAAATRLSSEIARAESVFQPSAGRVGDVSIGIHGRKFEQDALRAEYSLVEQGHSRFIKLLGQSGLGKTRLCEYFGRYCLLRGARVLFGRCYPSGGSIPYGGMADIIRGINDADVAHLSEAQVVALAPLIGQFAPARATRASADREWMRRQLLHAFEDLLRGMAAQRPMVIIIDDFHWADNSTVALVDRIVRRLRDDGILVLVAARPEEITEGCRVSALLAAMPSARRLQLMELDPASVTAIAEELQAKSGISFSPPLLDLIVRRAGGHPLFVVQLLTSICRPNASPQSDVARPGVDGSIPPSVDEYLRSRFAQLDAGARALIDGLAVIATAAPHELIREVVRLADLEYVLAAERLVAAGLISDQGSTLAFRHDLVREAAYALMSGARKAWLHGRTGRALERQRGEDPAILAEHYDRAGNRPKARRCAEMAASAAERMWALPEAERLLRIALRNARGCQNESRVAERLADCLLELGNKAEVDELYASAERMLSNVANEGRLLTLRAKRLSIACTRAPLSADDWAAVGRSISRILELPSTDVDRMTVVRHLLPAIWDGGRVELIADELHALLAHLESETPTPASLQLMARLCQILTLSEGPAIGLRSAEVLCRRAAELGDPSAIAIAHICRGLSNQYLGKVMVAEADYRKAKVVMERSHVGRYKTSLLTYWAVAKADTGDYEAAELMLKEVVEEASRNDDWRDRVCAEHNRAFYAYEQGRMHDARAAAQMAASIRGVGAWYNEASTWALLGLLALQEREMNEACESRARLLEIYVPRRLWGPDISYIEIFLARMEAEEGSRETALARLSEVITAYEQRDVFCRSRIQLEKARMLVDTDPEEARLLAREVRTRGSEIMARPLMDKAEAILRQLRAMSNSNPAPRRRP